MNSPDEFRPRWASPPGESIRQAMAERHWDLERLASELEVTTHVATDLLDGATRITITIARELANSLGGSTRFWMTRDARYCEFRDWATADRWVSLLPIRDMRSFGWIDRITEWQDNISACMEFFGVDSPGDLDGSKVRTAGASFRAKPRNAEQDAAIAAWVRKVELEAIDVQCGAWDHDGFRGTLPHIAVLSKTPDPRKFIPEITRLCSAVGVAVVAVRAPAGCPVNGVALTLPSGVRVIGLSGRYLADDHLWFTLFHEAGHLLLHDHDSIFVDEIEKGPSSDVDGPEAEADRFASQVLLPETLLTGVPRNPPPKVVHGLAKQAGISNGVVVGQLQHAGLLSFNSKLNRLKHRYQWDGTALTRGST